MNRNLLRFWVPALLLLATLQVPADAANREHQQMMADIRMLQEQTQQLQIQIGALSDALKEALKTISTKIDDHHNVSRKSFADQKLQLDGVSGDIRVVREKVDETNVRISSLSQEIEALRLAIPPPAPVLTLPPEGAGTPGTPAPGVPPETAATVPAPAPPPPSTAGLHPQKLYDMAWADYAAGNYRLAMTGFDGVLRTFPKSDLAVLAQYYIGEALAAENRFKEALGAYNSVIANYPGTRSVPDAYYKRALMLERLEQIPQARESLEFVLKNYPDTTAARLAKQVLDRLIRSKPGAGVDSR